MSCMDQVAAVVAVVTTLILPVLQISDDSMSDTLKERDVVLSLRRANCETGDIIAFKYNDKRDRKRTRT